MFSSNHDRRFHSEALSQRALDVWAQILSVRDDLAMLLSNVT